MSPWKRELDCKEWTGAVLLGLRSWHVSANLVDSVKSMVRDRPHWKAVFVVMVRLSTDCKEQNLGPDIFWFHRKVD